MHDHQYAIDAIGKWVSAKQTKYRAHQTFFCECPERHKMKLVKPSGLCGKRPFCDYFAHVQTSHKKQKTTTANNMTMMISSCSPGGESILHRMAKHRLREMVGMYSFPTFRCDDCSWEKIMHSKRGTVTMEVVSADKKWRYDCLLFKKGLPVAALEVVHTHLTGFVKVKSVRESGIEIAEFRADDVMNMINDGKTKTKLDNIQMQTGKCQDCLLKVAYKWHRDCFIGELFELMDQEESIAGNYKLVKKLTKERDMKLKLRYEFLVEKSKQWILDCFMDEIREIKMQEDKIARCSIRNHELKKALVIKDTLKKCKVLLTLSLNRLEIDWPLIGCWNLSFKTAVEWTHGLLVSDFSESLPTKMICIYFIDDRNIKTIHSISRQWKHPSVEDAFHIFLRCSTILSRLGTPEESPVVFKNCMWPIMKDAEASHGLCANCCRGYHTSDDCHFKFCVRCGRKGHLKRDCFAHKNVLDNYC